MHTASPRRSRYGWAALFALAGLLLLGLAGWRAMLVEQSYAEYSACSGCLHVASLSHDLLPVSLALLLVLLSRLLNSRIWRIALALLATTLVLAMAIDVVVFRLLHQRMYLAEVFRFAGESRASWSVARTLLGESRDIALLGTALAAVLVSALATLWPGAARPRWVVAGLATLALLPTLGLAVREPDYVLGESWQNVLEVNRPAPVDQAYSSAYTQAALHKPALPQQCQSGLRQRPDVIVLLIESLSAYHSQLFSGLMDATPELDALARANRYAPLFIANGFHSDGGLISVFAGRVPVPAVNRMSSIDAFVGFESASNDFFGELHRAGYESAFFTAGELSFLGKDRWTRSLGFDFAEGGESANYAGLAKGQFGAPEDAALFARVLDWHHRRPTGKPFFAGMLTVATHPPFVVPGTQHLDEQASFRHVDQLIRNFHDRLQERGFFRNGLLIVTGDHRSMTPLKPGERERFGDEAFARVPLVVIGPQGSRPGPIAGRFQHTDLVPSILQLIAPQVCLTALQGTLLAEPSRPARYALHTSGVRREQIQVFSADATASLVLDGDASRWEGTPPADGQALLDHVMADRIQRGPVRANRLDYLWTALGLPRDDPP